MPPPELAVTVAVPAKINREQRELILQLSEAFHHDNKPIKKGILEKVRDIFS